MEHFAPSAPTSSRLQGQALFVIGCARSGTTILQDALNDSDEVFLFGEPDFHLDPGSADFGRRYNDMHRSWRNQPTKSTFCPALFEGDATWRDYLERLSEHYRLVGSKIVLNPMTFLHDPERILHFYSREFYGANYIFTFRNPIYMLQSARDFQLATSGEVTPFEISMASYVAAVSLCLVMLRNLPHVHLVFHDSMNRRAFAGLEKFLQIPLPALRRYYDDGRVTSYDVQAALERHGEDARLVFELYRDFRRAAMKGFDLVQLGQNNANASPAHLTPLGQLTRRCERISGRFACGKVVVGR